MSHVHEPDTHMLFVDAIVGFGFPSMTFADLATKEGLARFDGNQWNESWAWAWERSALDALPDNELQSLYLGLQQHRKRKNAR